MADYPGAPSRRRVMPTPTFADLLNPATKQGTVSKDRKRNERLAGYLGIDDPATFEIATELQRDTSPGASIFTAGAEARRIQQEEDRRQASAFANLQREAALANKPTMTEQDVQLLF